MNKQKEVSSQSNTNPTECAWCFNKMTKARIPAYGFVFCSHDCAFRHQEFEGQFKK